MNLWKYRYLVDVIDTKSFTKAGIKNYVSQTAVSQQIHALEKDLGAKLVSRGKKETIPTELGNYVYQKAKEMISIENEIYNHIHERINSEKPRIIIDNSIGQNFWNLTQEVLNKNWDEYNFWFEKMPFSSASASLESDEADAYIGYNLGPELLNNVKSKLLCKNKIGVILSSRSPFIHNEMLSLDALQTCRKYATQEYYPSTFLLKNVLPKDFSESAEMISSTDTMIMKVEMNKGISFVDGRFFHEFPCEIHAISDLNETCDLQIFYRTDKDHVTTLVESLAQKLASVLNP